MRIRLYFVSIISLLIVSTAFAEKNVGFNKRDTYRASSKSFKVLADCEPAQANVDLDVNNVRATILAGGDMWWDLTNAKYEIPKVNPGSGEPSRNMMFAGALWFGGVDAGGNLKIAAQTYRQTGVDFWPGPLDTVSSNISQERCKFWDKHFKVNKLEIQRFMDNTISPDPTYIEPEVISEWPGQGGFGETQNLAPYFDFDGDGTYSSGAGDFPLLPGDVVTGDGATPLIAEGADQMIWWVYNDKGDVHGETGGDQIGIEIQVTAFAFATGDAINDMTFYKYKIVNRSNSLLQNTYFGQWVDSDVGFAFDDYVQCDVGRSLGISFNGDDFDDNLNGYGLNPPSIGVDFFEGPIGDDGNELGLAKFMYYNNDANPASGNPDGAQHFYNYLRGIWGDGVPVSYGGTGYNPSNSDLANYMFPGQTDPDHNNNWTEITEGNVPADRRFLQSAGPFTLLPGAVNNITVGLVFARATSGGATGSLNLLRQYDDQAQKLFNQNFKLLEGPKAPKVAITELDRKIILTFEDTYDPTVELFNEELKDEFGGTDIYKFQGYLVYQLAESNVSITELGDPDRARLILQSDIQDAVDKVVNLEFDVSVSAFIPVLKVDGNNNGLVRTFLIDKDAFALDDERLVNSRQYHFLVLAYAVAPTASDLVFLPSSRTLGKSNLVTYTAVPHITSAEFGGSKLNSEFGDGIPVMRIKGKNNGGNIVDLTPETINKILNSPDHKADTLIYLPGKSPIKIEVYDPKEVPAADFEVKMFIENGSKVAGWNMINLETGDTIESTNGITSIGQIMRKSKTGEIPIDWGFIATTSDVLNPGGGNITPGTTRLDSVAPNNGLLETTIVFDDPLKPWLTGVQNSASNGETNFDWAIGLGANSVDFDPNNDLKLALNGTFSTYQFSSDDSAYGPKKLNDALAAAQYRSRNVSGYDIRITSDKSLWTKCPVIELGGDPSLVAKGTKKWKLRESPSKNKEGNEISGETGYGWFPGYAINVETGERVNIIWGEDSWYGTENGNDMLWNPTSTIRSGVGGDKFTNFPFGGKHYTYIQRTRYDEGKKSHEVIESGSFNDFAQFVTGQIDWVTIPVLASPESKLLETGVTIRLRVTKPYQAYPNKTDTPVYVFSTRDYAATVGSKNILKASLDNIRAVPNPYYGFSQYEVTKVDNVVRITNLPPSANISIYSPDGTLVRRIIKNNDSSSYLDWDLTNDNRIPIASGVYLINIKVPGVGEKTIKWYGSIRPIDLDTF
ncbi:MAG: hypothetical protein ACJAZ3_000038 [Sphingobacteriales bacterium]|jgi:hypothetical protein